MIRKAFVDSDVILDLATGREPFIEHSKAVLSIIENGYAIGVISSNSVTIPEKPGFVSLKGSEGDETSLGCKKRAYA
jgi:hypothetical protein